MIEELKRFRIYVIGNVVGISLYADHFVVSDDQIWFFMDKEKRIWSAIMTTSEISKITTGLTADDIVWKNKESEVTN